MSTYDSNNFSSDLDAYKWLNDELTTTITISGTLQDAGTVGEVYFNSPTLTLPYEGGDFRVWTFDNSYYHNGEYRRDSRTYVYETTLGTPITVGLQAIVDGNTIRFRARMLNPYGFNVALTTTTLDIRVLVYDATVI